MLKNNLNSMKKITGTFAILLFTLIIACLPLNVKADTFRQSGRNSVPKFSFEQLAGLYDAVESYSSLYRVGPYYGNGNYQPAVLSDQAYKTGLEYINYYRLCSGVSTIDFTAELNTSSGYGALISAANGVTSHNPSKPSDMPSLVFNRAFEAANNSNLATSSNYGETRAISLAIMDQISDNSGSNVATVGHRRWLLDPTTKTMGIGCAHRGSSYFTDVRVCGDGIAKASNVNDYEFISWPASGNNLSETFDVSTPWSVSLNPNWYATPDKSQITVTVTKEGTSTSWTFNQSTGTTVSTSSPFFNVNTNNSGLSNCIIFRPAYRNLSSFRGDYIVQISGLRYSNGTPTTLSYKVSFEKRRYITADNSVANMLTATNASYQESVKTTVSAPQDTDTHPVAAEENTQEPAPSQPVTATAPAPSQPATTTTPAATPAQAQQPQPVQQPAAPVVQPAPAPVQYPGASFISYGKAGKKSATLAWSTSGGADGFDILYSNKANFKSAKTLRIYNNVNTFTVSKLKSKKKTYFRIRSYKIINGAVVYGPWSNVKIIKVK